ncbi:MAG TPA: hypothetical protein EYP14_16055, partial [Planctomycetaceae bacterium]|nr:hypothetical protein [Planctomycetaceae bacterium]
MSLDASRAAWQDGNSWKRPDFRVDSLFSRPARAAEAEGRRKTRGKRTRSRVMGARIGRITAIGLGVLGMLGSVTAVCAELGPSPDLRATARQLLDAAGIHGGLIVHLGCDDARLTAALRVSDAYLVHGLDRDEEAVRRARRSIRSLGAYGPVSVSRLKGPSLPYADNLVNLIVVTGSVERELRGELARVLALGGVILICGQPPDGPSAPLTVVPCRLERWTKWVKPWPDTIDQWTHYLHGPDNNSVAQDAVVGPPRHFQWIAPPRFSRSHDHLASVSAVVSARGRLFSIVDKGPTAFAAASLRWRLEGRDAFSGVLLWERPIARWEYHLRDFRSGPADLARRLVAVDDRVYVTLGYGEPVSILDAATGRTIRTCAGTEGTREIVYDNGVLFLVIGRAETDWPARKAQQMVSQPGYRPPFERYTPPAHDKSLVAVDAASGKRLWRVSGSIARDILPSTLAVDGGRVFFQNADAVVCLDAVHGRVKWRTPRPVQRKRLAWSTPTLVVHDGVVFSADRKAAETRGELLWIPSGGYHEYLRGDVQGELIALDAETGRRLWSCPAWEGFNSPVDVLITDGLLWTGRFAWGRDPGITEGRDPKTGKVLRRRLPDQRFMGRRIGHARCHRARATIKYLLMGRRGLEFVDVKTGRNDRQSVRARHLPVRLPAGQRLDLCSATCLRLRGDRHAEMGIPRAGPGEPVGTGARTEFGFGSAARTGVCPPLGTPVAPRGRRR